MTKWQMVAPACAIAATVAVGACGRNDGSSGNQWAGKPANGQRASNVARGDATGLAGNAVVQDEGLTNEVSGMAVSLVGCVRRAAPGGGRYVLSDVQTAGVSSTPGTVGMSGRTEDSAEASSLAGNRYDLVARSGQELGDHVGHRVKITGRLAPPAGYTSNGSTANSPGGPAGTSGTGSPAADGGINRSGASTSASRTMYVGGVQRFGEDTCSSGSASSDR